MRVLVLEFVFGHDPVWLSLEQLKRQYAEKKAYAQQVRTLVDKQQALARQLQQVRADPDALAKQPGVRTALEEYVRRNRGRW